jgi:hypothetical protein
MLLKLNKALKSQNKVQPKFTQAFEKMENYAIQEERV